MLTAVATVGTAVVLVAVASMLLRGRPLEAFYGRWLFHNAPAAVVMLWMGRLVLRRRWGHGAGLVVLIIGAVASAHVGVAAVVDARMLATGVDDLAAGATFVPAELPWSASVPLWVMKWLWVPVPVLATTMLLLVFPDGHLPHGRWRWAAWLAVGGGLLLMIAHAIVAWPATAVPISSTEVPVGDHPVSAALVMIGGLGVLAAALTGVATLVGRWRRATGEQRRPFRAVGAAAIVLALVGTLTWPWQPVWRPAVLVAFVGVLVTYALAAARYRIHDLDPVLGRAAVAAVLAAGVTGVYLAIVVGIGGLVGRGTEVRPLPLVAVGAVALLIEPARRQARRLVDRLLYGRDTDRAEVLSQLAEAASTATDADEVLDRVCDLLMRSTGARRVEVWLHGDDADHLAAAAGPVEDSAPILAIAVVHQDERLGEVRLRARHPADLAADAEQLARDVTRSLGVFLRTARLTAELRDHVTELRRSRHRLVEVHHEARRQLERDLHDGAQAQLIALRLRLGAVQALATSDGNGALSQELENAATQLDGAVASLRDLARGLYSPLLEQAGVAAALRATARGLPLPVSVRDAGLGRYQRAIEAAVYFCCLEALQNASRHAHASHIIVALGEESGTVRFEVADDGVGFDPERHPAGAGLVNIGDRLAAVGGQLRIDSTPGSGTRISGEVPAHAAVSAR